MTPPLLDEWVTDLSTRVSSGTQALYTYKIRRAYRHLASRRAGRILAEDPADELRGCAVYVEQGHPISDDDLDLALTAARPDRRLYTWHLLEAGTGIRPVQIASLTRRRVRYEKQRALLTVRGKGREMVVIAGPDIAEQLRYWTRIEAGPLWRNAAGRPVTAHNVMRAVNAHLARLGIQSTSHGLRRWFAQHVSELADMRTVQELLGHASLTTTARYVRPREDERAEIADTLSARLVRRNAS